ncbi:hypothetical protein SmJEL517_g02138 [Synchytrium microbalum]|uniref:Spindle assembly checkpoint component MAD1 n=1 Tax=Synchytrium microbalum TaxID=1806994 RepID=A0A507C7P4_9FUNG|nr:uncharacterized protein SmJEL517_g02138 [Synchytrium microbalum]TPX35521.1 hypothetical protein SmJEL517_g02138 [Synchytrium microbalum]
MTLYGVGSNAHGQLGNGTIEDTATPTKVNLPNSVEHPIQCIAGGGNHSLLIDANGKLYASGLNSRGQLGSNQSSTTFEFIETPVLFRSVACGWEHSAAIDVDRCVWVTGDNCFGQLGLDSGIVNVTKWTKLPNLSQAIEISCGVRSTAVLTADGLYVCGSNQHQALGLPDKIDITVKQPGTRRDRGTSSIVSIPTLSPWEGCRHVSMSQYHGAVIAKERTIHSFGRNNHNQLSQPNKERCKFDSLSTGWSHTLALSTEGIIYSYGRNDHGQLGRAADAESVALPEKASEISTGSEHSLALLQDGRVASWGWNEHGQCGVGNNKDVHQPEELVEGSLLTLVTLPDSWSVKNLLIKETLAVTSIEVAFSVQRPCRQITYSLELASESTNRAQNAAAPLTNRKSQEGQLMADKRFHPYAIPGSTSRNARPSIAEPPMTPFTGLTGHGVYGSTNTLPSSTLRRPVLNGTPSLRDTSKTLESIESIFANFKTPSSMPPDSSPGRRSIASTDSNMDIYADPDVLELKKQLKDARREARETQRKLERQIADMELVNSRQSAKLVEATQRVESLESDRKFLMQRETAASTELEEIRNQSTSTRSAFERTTSELRRENAEMKEQLSLKTSENDASIADLTFANQQLEETSARTQRRLSELEQEYQTIVTARQQERAQLLHLQSQLMRTKTLLASQSNSEDDDSALVLQKQLHDQIIHIQNLESSNKQLQAENTYLKSHYENTEKLHEKTRALESQLAMMSDLRKRCAELDTELSKLKGEKLRWSSFLDKEDNTGMDSPFALSKELAKNRLDLIISKDRIGKHDAEIRAKDEYIAQLEVQAQESDAKLRVLEEKYNAELKTSKRTERSRAFAQKEVDFFRDQLKSYDLEEQNLTANFDTVKSERIKSLETLVEEYRQQIRLLESEHTDGDSNMTDATVGNAVMQKHTAELTEELRTAQKALETLQTENALLVKQLTASDEQLRLLENALGRGEYNTATTSVLQLRNNPESDEFAIRQATLNALQAENKSLRERLVNRSDAGLPIESFKTVEQDCQRLQKELVGRDTKLQRLRMAYQAKATEYREAVFKYLGYKVDLEESGIRFVPMHAEGEPSVVISSDGTGIQVVKGDRARAQHIDSLVVAWVKQKSSIPGFFASWALDLIERRR